MGQTEKLICDTVLTEASADLLVTLKIGSSLSHTTLVRKGKAFIASH